MTTWIDSTLAEFGRTIGLGHLTLGSEGILSLDLGADARLTLRAVEEAVLVMLSRPLQPGAASAMQRRALRLCSLEHGTRLPARAGITPTGELLFLVRIPERQFCTPVLEDALAQLAYLQQRAAHT